MDYYELETNEVSLSKGISHGTYRIHSHYAKDTVAITARGLLDLTDWVIQNRTKLKNEVDEEDQAKRQAHEELVGKRSSALTSFVETTFFSEAVIKVTQGDELSVQLCGIDGTWNVRSDNRLPNYEDLKELQAVLIPIPALSEEEFRSLKEEAVEEEFTLLVEALENSDLIVGLQDEMYEALKKKERDG